MGARDATESIEQLLQSLEQLDHGGVLEGKKSDLTFLRNMLKTPEFHSLLNAHNAVSKGTGDHSPRPNSLDAVTLSNVISYDAEIGPSSEEQELFELLSLPHVAALITAHDKVANKEYPLQSTVAVDTGGGSGLEANASMRVVRIAKKTDPLGATVRRDKEGLIIISRVLHGGVASRSGMLHPGDVVHEINKKPIEGWSIDQVATYMQTLLGVLTFKITPAVDEFTPKKRKDVFHIRSLVSYDPKEDVHHPCQEAGLAFGRGTILQVLDREDPDWWQAMVAGGDKDGVVVGLIPSKKHMEFIVSRYKSKPNRNKSHDKNKDYTPSNHVFGSEVVTYEDMTKIDPQQERPRPIMLIAPRNGPFTLNDLKQKLLRENHSIFGTPIPHTSRPMKGGEQNGEGFNFIQRTQMEKAIVNGEIIEHGILSGHYYGTSINSIRSIINSGKTCLLVLDPQTIKLVRTPDLRPFIIYLTTPTAEFMKNNWVPSKIKDSAVLDVVRQATYLEKTYGHYFDHYISYDNIDAVHRDILELARQLCTNFQWVPTSWIKT